MQRPFGGNSRLRVGLTFISFVAPLVLGQTLFIYWPMVRGFIISLNESRGAINSGNFIGIRNYLTLVRSAAFLRSLRNVAFYGLVTVPSTMALAMWLAVAIRRRRRGKGVLRLAFFLPQACSIVIAAVVWRTALFSGMPFGFANTVRGVFGATPIPWTQSVIYVWVPLITLRVWISVGLYMILYSVSLDAIPQEIYDAAEMEGAEGGFRLFRLITFPLLNNTHIVVLFLLIVNVFRAFDEFMLVAGSGQAILQVPLVQTPMVYLYVTSFGGQDFGLGTAGSFVIAAVIVLATSIQSRLTGFGRPREE